MAVTDQLPAPQEHHEVKGQDCLHRYVRSEAAASAPVTWANLAGIVSVTVGEPTYATERDVFQQGSKDHTHIKRDPMWPVTINCLSGKGAEVIAAILGETWGASHVGIPFHATKDEPQIILESIFRRRDNETHVFSRVLQDLILDSKGHDNPMEYADDVINLHTYYPPFYVYAGYEAVLDVWAATPSTNTYTLSSTPATILTASSHDFWEFDNAAFIKNKDDSAGDSVGVRLTSGVSISGVTMTFTAGTPATSDVISCLYVTAT